MRRLTARILALDWLNRGYDLIWDEPDASMFSRAALRFIGAGYDVDPADVARIPRQGALVVVANHPFGCIEGLILGQILAEARGDVRLLANYFLGRLRSLRQRLILVDPFGGADATTANAAPLRQALRWLADGGVLGVFPAGEVAHLNWRPGPITDPTWSPTVARLVRLSGAAVLPVFFEGRNSTLFQIAGLVHPRLRTLLLARELRRQAGRRVRVRIGRVIPPGRLESMGDAETTRYLRRRTFALGARDGARPIVRTTEPARLAADIAALPPHCTLVRGGDFDVVCATAGQIPSVLREIGRLRETTFRETGEGTGRPIDLDRFDRDYLHLFAWHRPSRQVVGAYRLGRTDELLARHGIGGLYTATLFDYSSGWVARINPGLELGRSFVRREFQRAYQPLMLLWKGIFRYVALNPRYAVCFGAASISGNYRTASRQLMVRFMRMHHRMAGADEMVRARHAWDAEDGANWVDDGRALAERVARIEPDGNGMPVLLRQYLKMGAKLLAVGQDRSFGNCIDALLMIDLRQADPRMLDRYMGPMARRAFLARAERAGAKDVEIVDYH